MKYAVILSVVALIVFTAFSLFDDKEDSIARGEEIYILYCQECHQSNGEGIEGLYPPLAGSDYLFNNIEQSIQVILMGSDGDIVVNGKTHIMDMDPIYLSDEYIADVMNYILNTWGNSYDGIITEDNVKALR